MERLTWFWTAAFAACLAGAACSANRDVVVEPPVAFDVTLSSIVVLPDTQFYSCKYASIFEAQTSFVAEHHADLNLRLTLHTGDIVDTQTKEQWRVAQSSFAALDNEVPYLVTTGNHDVDAQRSSRIAEYLGAPSARAGTDVHYFESGHPENSFAIIHLGSRDWLFMGLEFGPRDRVLDWAGEVLEQHSDLPAVLFTHAYLWSDGHRYDRDAAESQAFHPDRYQVTPNEGINDGEDIWQRIVLPNRNVQVVLSGHVTPDGTARAESKRPDGSVVHELLADYQTCISCPCEEVHGGNGYLRIMQFADRSIRVWTYSPYLNEWLTDADNQFEFDVGLAPEDLASESDDSDPSFVSGPHSGDLVGR